MKANKLLITNIYSDDNNTITMKIRDWLKNHEESDIFSINIQRETILSGQINHVSEVAYILYTL